MTTTSTAPVGEHAELLGTSELVLLGGAPLLLLLSAFSVAAITLRQENTLNHQQLPRYARSQP